MGKSKSKKGQLKRYETPSDKYVIVVDPWGGVPRDPDFFNNVTAWFEIMFKPKYGPGVRPSAIYVQGTNRHIILEIPDSIDVEPYLGAHYWKDFLDPGKCGDVKERASFVYEYDWRNHPVPAAQGGWRPGFARYTKIRDDFDVLEPYRSLPPRLAPISPLAFAKKLPPGRALLPGQQALGLPPLPIGVDPLPGVGGLPGVPAQLDEMEGVDGAQGVNIDGRRAESRRSPSQSTPLSSTPSATRPNGSRRPQTFMIRDPRLFTQSGSRSGSSTPGPSSTSSSSRSSRQPSQVGERQESEGSSRGSSVVSDPHQFKAYNRPGHLSEAEALLSTIIPSSSSALSSSRSSSPPSSSSTTPFSTSSLASSSSRVSSTTVTTGVNTSRRATRESTRYQEADEKDKMSMPPPPLPPQGKLGKKMDPYEEEEIALAVLHRSPSQSSSITMSSGPPPSPTPSRTPTSMSRTVTPTTTTNSTPAPCRSMSIKSEMEVEDHLLSSDLDRYTPSAELQNAFASLDGGVGLGGVEGQGEGEDIKPIIKSEPDDDDDAYLPLDDYDEEEEDGNTNDRYKPSEGLLEALASLPGGMVDLDQSLNSTPVATTEEENIRVKDEPTDEPVVPSSTRETSSIGKRNRPSMSALKPINDSKKVRLW